MIKKYIAASLLVLTSYSNASDGKAPFNRKAALASLHGKVAAKEDERAPGAKQVVKTKDLIAQAALLGVPVNVKVARGGRKGNRVSYLPDSGSLQGQLSDLQGRASY